MWTKISLSDEISAIQLSGGARVEVNQTEDTFKAKTTNLNDGTILRLSNQRQLENIDLDLSKSSLSALSTLVCDTFDSVNITTGQNKDFTLGSVVYATNLTVDGNIISLGGSLRTVNEKSHLVLNANELTIGQDVELKAGNVLLHGRRSLTAESGSVIESYAQSSCNQDGQTLF